MQKRDFSQARRDKAAKSGAAMKDGSYPIYTAGDLHNAVMDYDRTGQSPAVKAHIRQRAKDLGAADPFGDDAQKSDAATSLKKNASEIMAEGLAKARNIPIEQARGRVALALRKSVDAALRHGLAKRAPVKVTRTMSAADLDAVTASLSGALTVGLRKMSVMDGLKARTQFTQTFTKTLAKADSEADEDFDDPTGTEEAATEMHGNTATVQDVIPGDEDDEEEEEKAKAAQAASDAGVVANAEGNAAGDQTALKTAPDGALRKGDNFRSMLHGIVAGMEQFMQGGGHPADGAGTSPNDFQSNHNQTAAQTGRQKAIAERIQQGDGTHPTDPRKQPMPKPSETLANASSAFPKTHGQPRADGVDGGNPQPNENVRDVSAGAPRRPGVQVGARRPQPPGAAVPAETSPQAPAPRTQVGARRAPVRPFGKGEADGDLAKFNHNHDDHGRFSSAGAAASEGAKIGGKLGAIAGSSVGIVRGAMIGARHSGPIGAGAGALLLGATGAGLGGIAGKVGGAAAGVAAYGAKRGADALSHGASAASQAIHRGIEDIAPSVRQGADIGGKLGAIAGGWTGTAVGTQVGRAKGGLGNILAGGVLGGATGALIGSQAGRAVGALGGAGVHAGVRVAQAIHHAITETPPKSPSVPYATQRAASTAARKAGKPGSRAFKAAYMAHLQANVPGLKEYSDYLKTHPDYEKQQKAASRAAQREEDNVGREMARQLSGSLPKGARGVVRVTHDDGTVSRHRIH